MTSQDIQAQRQTADHPRRSFGWLGPAAVLAALTSALTTFLVLSGATPILPTHDVVVWVFILNGALIILLIDALLSLWLRGSTRLTSHTK